MFQNISINLAPNNMFPTFYPEKDEAGITPQTRALFFCMIATGVERFFTYDDMREFVFRIAVMFRQSKLIENYFREGYLFELQSGENRCHITSNDLMAHLGLYTTNYPDKAMPRDEWFDNMQRCWENAVWLSILGGAINPLAHLVFEETSEDETNVRMKSLDIHYTDTDIDNAVILAENVMKEIPVEPFVRFYEKEKDSLQKIEDYLAFAKSPLPINFNWDSIPYANQQAILKFLVEERFYFEGMTMDDAINKYADWVPDLVYLAWIKANGFAGNLYHDELDPRVKIDPSRYDELGTDSGINLGMTYDSANLQEIEKYLVHKEPEVIEYKKECDQNQH